MLEFLKNNEWSGSNNLYKLLNENNFYAADSINEIYIMLNENEELVSYGALLEQDDVLDPSLRPWIGFVYVKPEFRGNRYSQKIINHMLKIADDLGEEKVYLHTEHLDLYEKYGFVYLFNRIDKYDREVLVYHYEL